MPAPRLPPLALLAPPRAPPARRTPSARRRALCELVAVGGLLRAGCQLGRALPVGPMAAEQLAQYGSAAELAAHRRAAAAHLWGPGLAFAWLGVRAVAAGLRQRPRQPRGFAAADTLLRRAGALAAADVAFAAAHVALSCIGRRLVPPLPQLPSQLGIAIGGAYAARCGFTGWLAACRVADGLDPPPR